MAIVASSTCSAGLPRLLRPGPAGKPAAFDFLPKKTHAKFNQRDSRAKTPNSNQYFLSTPITRP
jgi:hypothetical protein